MVLKKIFVIDEQNNGTTEKTRIQYTCYLNISIKVHEEEHNWHGLCLNA